MDESLKDITVRDINSIYELVVTAAKVLEAALWASEGDYKTSITLLKEAVALRKCS